MSLHNNVAAWHQQHPLWVRQTRKSDWDRLVIQQADTSTRAHIQAGTTEESKVLSQWNQRDVISYWFDILRMKQNYTNITKCIFVSIIQNKNILWTRIKLSYLVCLNTNILFIGYLSSYIENNCLTQKAIQEYDDVEWNLMM